MDALRHIDDLLIKKLEQREELQRRIDLIDAEMKGLEQAKAAIQGAAETQERFAEVVANTGRRNRA